MINNLEDNVFEIYDLRTEYVNNPLNIDVEQPRFSWKLKSSLRDCTQEFYRIVVTKVSPGENTVVWDSGMVESSKTLEILYEGKNLLPASAYIWELTVIGNRGNRAFAKAFFETGLYKKADWKGAKWIGKDFGTHSPLCRRFFKVKGEVYRARLYICGLGYYQAYINGKKIGDYELESPFTNYKKRVLYRAWDVTSLVDEGDNCLGAELGRGFYGLLTDNVWNWHKSSWIDNPKLIALLKIDYTDGTSDFIITDESWEACAGPRTSDSVYLGEKYDARLEVPGWNLWVSKKNPEAALEKCVSTAAWGRWHNVDIVSPPEGELHAANLPPIKKATAYFSVSVTNPTDKVYVYDFGIMTAGWAKLTARAQRGTEVKIRYGEKIDERGRVITDNNCLKELENQTDTYIFQGTPDDVSEEFEPCFSYKGFRYVEVEGLADLSAENLTVYAVHTAVETVGSFECSNDLFNQIHKITLNTMLNNLHGIPTDTPYFEKNGWMGDANIMMDSFMLNFDMQAFISKWMDDIRDSMPSPGRVILLAPIEQWGHGHSPQWNSAYITGLLCLYKYYGDISILKNHYSSLLDYAAYEEMELKDHISNSCLNDWCAPKHDKNQSWGAPEGNAGSATVFAYYIFQSTSYVASLLGDSDSADHYSKLARKVCEAFNERFFLKDKGYYVDENADVGYRQTPSILPLAFDLVEEEHKDTVLKNLLYDIVHVRDSHLNTGILGTKYLLPLLCNCGHQDLAFKVASQETFPSWGFWLANGATSLWEEWSLDSRSRNHYFFGTIDEWFYNYVAGIRVYNDLDLFKIKSSTIPNPIGVKLVFKPYIMGDLYYARASVDTVWGLASILWRNEGSFSMEVTIPANTSALIFVPCNISGRDIALDNLFDGDIPITKSDSIKYLGSDNGYFVFEARSGMYEISETNN